MRYWLVMPAAGTGRRFGAGLPKQYAPLAGRCVIEWALQPFLADARCVGAVVAIADGDAHWPEVAARLAVQRTAARLRTAPGGAERGHSVRNALRLLAEGGSPADAASAVAANPGDWVVVHDAARPCLPPGDLDRLLHELASHPVGGLLAQPPADTVKRAGFRGEVADTIDRSVLWRALTPQMFRLGGLLAALDTALQQGRMPTDESQAMEWSGLRPRLVPGSATNIKITAAADLELAAALLSSRSA